MANPTRAELVEKTREYMDAVNSERWSDAIILDVLNIVYDSEWSNILNAAAHYTFASRSVTTDSGGKFAFSDLSDVTSPDAEQNWYRILSMSNGNEVFGQTAFEDVPLGTSSQYPSEFGKLYYLVGTNVQVLPVASGTALTVSVNYKPTALRDLSADTVVIDFPSNSYMILAWQAAAQLLLKGGTESDAASVLLQLADSERASMLDDLRRRTINPTVLRYPDSKNEWGG